MNEKFYKFNNSKQLLDNLKNGSQSNFIGNYTKLNNKMKVAANNKKTNHIKELSKKDQ